jgi:hypothetical protein
MRSFEKFESSNDERLAAIEKRGGDVIVEQKVARIDAALDVQQVADAVPVATPTRLRYAGPSSQQGGRDSAPGWRGDRDAIA